MNPSAHDKIYPVAKIAVMVELLAEEGVAAEDALADVGLSAEELRLPATKVSAAQVLQACRNAFRLSDDPKLPYRAGTKFCVSTYGMYGFAALSSPDFRETITFAVTYHRLATPLMAVSFREDGGAGVWTTTPMAYPGIDGPLAAFIAKLHMAVLLSLHRKLLGMAFKPSLVAYALGEAYEDAEGTAYFGCPVRYGEAENTFTFAASWLDRQPDFGNESVYSELRQLCHGLLQQFELGTGVAGQVRRLILSNLPRPVGFEQVAKGLNMSERSLRRRLQEEGTSFGRLADELRGQVAMQYVRDTELSVEDIAYMLGFSDASSFRQAFRRWTNAAPQEFRKGANGARRETGADAGR